MGSLRVVIAGFDPIYRAGLCTVLPTSGARAVSVVGYADEMQATLRLVRLLRPDVVLTNSRFLRSDVAVIERLRETHDRLRVLILDSDAEMSRLRQAVEEGASGYLFRPVTKRHLLDALHATASDSSGAPFREPVPPAASLLSEREQEILHLLALGHTNAEIATVLVLSVRTVETHRSNIQRKLGVRTRSELVRHARMDESGAPEYAVHA